MGCEKSKRRYLYRIRKRTCGRKKIIFSVIFKERKWNSLKNFIFAVVIVAVLLQITTITNGYISESSNIDKGNDIYKTFQKIENQEISQKENLLKSERSEDDLVYREYTWGHYLEKGYDLFIDKEKIISKMENVQSIIIIWDDKAKKGEYKEISFDDNDVVFILEKSGNYTFLAGDANGDFVDISSIVKVNVSSPKQRVVALK